MTHLKFFTDTPRRALSCAERTRLVALGCRSAYQRKVAETFYRPGDT